jgi:hypothetical protein
VYCCQLVIAFAQALCHLYASLWLLLGYAKRHTFYIGVDGTGLKIDTAVSPTTSAQDMAATLGELGIAKP